MIALKKVYACLIGNWVCLNDDPDCVIGTNRQSPSTWFEEGADVYAPTSRNPKNTNKYTELDYVYIHYMGKDYRINPIYIQIQIG